MTPATIISTTGCHGDHLGTSIAEVAEDKPWLRRFNSKTKWRGGRGGGGSRKEKSKQYLFFHQKIVAGSSVTRSIGAAMFGWRNGRVL